MNSQKFGYIRVSTIEQNISRQLEGLELDRTFIDKTSGKNIQRPELESLMQFARAGDTIVVHSMDRFARNLDDLRKIVKYLTEKGVKIQFLKENLIFTGEDSPMSNLLLSVMGAFAEFERALIRERQLEGISLAKKRGAYAGRKRGVTDIQINMINSRVANGEKKAQIAREIGISRETLYKYLRQTKSTTN